MDHYGDIQVDPGYSILPDTRVDLTGHYLYVLSTNKVNQHIQIHIEGVEGSITIA